jgi:DNA-binding transcriptional ArsR family regulator
MTTYIFVGKWLHVDKRRDVFQAIADPTRREIINLLSKQSLNLNGIADYFDSSRPTISQHIKILAECGLIVIQQQGRERYCQMKWKPLHEVSDWIAPYRKHWENKLDKLDSYLNQLKKEKNHGKHKR